MPKPLPRKTYQPERPRGVAPSIRRQRLCAQRSQRHLRRRRRDRGFRMRSQWQMVVDVNGCKMTGLEKNLSGDSLSYMVGPRWTPPVTGQLVPYFQVLFGGNKLTQELVFPQQESYLVAVSKINSSEPPDRSQYAQQFESDGFAFPPAWDWISTSTAHWLSA